jgi:hypothetical protein
LFPHALVKMFLDLSHFNPNSMVQALYTTMFTLDNETPSTPLTHIKNQAHSSSSPINFDVDDDIDSDHDPNPTSDDNSKDNHKFCHAFLLKKTVFQAEEALQHGLKAKKEIVFIPSTALIA